MSETNKPKIINASTLVPIGVIAAAVVVAMAVGGLFTRVEALERLNSPSRDEYRQLMESVTYIRNNMLTKGDIGAK